MTRLLFLCALLLAGPSVAATSDPVATQTLSARLLSATDGVGTGTTVVSAGLQVDLAEGWKTYWRSPGEVGLPPQISWEGSENIADVALSYPAPERFTAFDIENFGYGDQVVFPLTLSLADPGQAARLTLRADLLVCAEVCIPETVDLTLDLPQGGAPDPESAALLSDWIARVPVAETDAGLSVERVHLGQEALTLALRADPPLQTPDIFPEQGAYAAFGAPEVRLADGGSLVWARLPVLAPGEGALDLTLVDGARAATFTPPLSATPPPQPDQHQGLLWMAMFAFVGGLILNVMPCVLPVLSIKLASAMGAQGKSTAQIRAGFLASVAGVLTFFVALAAVLIALRAGGVAIGWGVQFQNPVFLSVMVGLMVLFAANLVGLFEIGLSSRTQTALGGIEARGGLRGDFATGAFAAVMATPCSAPFLGTAVTFALTSGWATTLGIFTAMGGGLALPYLLVAARPGLVQRLPRPGAWMVHIRRVLGGLMVLAALWLVTVLAGAAGWTVAGGVAAAALVMVAALALRGRALPIGAAGLAAMVALTVVLPAAAPTPAQVSGAWQPFERTQIATEVAAGRAVFVDVTADWCLTCKVNKRLVLDTDPVARALDAPEVTALRADWTRPNEGIANFLRDNGRFGIPFNAVYGPGAPDGIPLPEILTEAAVMAALDRAAGP
ncbi:suppressor for copper-sensitivity B [Jannaschia pagri]|uniref:Suppressor for copper-sensitivity B n=1 Tax=Jannaschia pagri TaxID=2829797 RepID=A0ABQ4NIF8_9RHOB|nr:MULTISPECIES: protein-disulfide reductase DsbD domain-containing protein [unclassified Jannaschia]GIT89686.1 suppressor for copper-sensitivity B [Jannaschia sp. AI_61]GIT94206.1 suppressor for copper-sensitivity B [Jannaschia sp. AI_62]